MTPTEIKEIEELIALQKFIDDKIAFDFEQANKYADLLRKHQEYKNLKADAMANKLSLAQKEAPSIQIQEGKDNNSILDDFNAQFKDEPWYKKPEPADDGSTSLAFPSYNEAAQFFHKQAEKGREFLLIDATSNKVLAYSDGSGKMFHPDGKEFGKNDSFSPGLDLEEFSQQHQAREKNQTPSPGVR